MLSNAFWVPFAGFALVMIKKRQVLQCVFISFQHCQQTMILPREIMFSASLKPATKMYDKCNGMRSVFGSVCGIGLQNDQ